MARLFTKASVLYSGLIFNFTHNAFHCRCNLPYTEAQKTQAVGDCESERYHCILVRNFSEWWSIYKILAFTRTNKDPRTLLTYSTAENEAVT